METLLGKLENVLSPLFKGLPSLPKNAKEWFVKAWPILALIFRYITIVSSLELMARRAPSQ